MSILPPALHSSIAKRVSPTPPIVPRVIAMGQGMAGAKKATTELC
jgi:hypothetical protein